MSTSSPKKNNLVESKKTSANILIPRLIFIIISLGLVLFGLVMVFSASSVEAINNGNDPYYFLIRQCAFALLGIIAAVIVWRVIPIAAWRTNWAWVFFGVCLVLMAVTSLVGPTKLGARRWIYLFGFSFQSSEFGKIALIILVAKLHYECQLGKITFLRFFITAGISVAINIAVVFLAQSDMGTAAIMMLGIIVVLWIGRCPKPILIMIIAGLIFFGICAVLFGSSYRMDRFLFLDPYNDGQNGYGAGYQIIRSQYAFSQGGVFGHGLGSSYEKYQYLPEAETDYIFAVIGEELGMVGCVFVVLLFIGFLISGLYVARTSGSLFGAEISGSFVIMIVAQAFINMMCTLGMFPTTGKPLPFISYGGSSLLATLCMVGFILAASEEAALPDEFEKKRSTFKIIQAVKGLTSFAGESALYNSKKIKSDYYNRRTQRVPLQNLGTVQRQKTAAKSQTPNKSTLRFADDKLKVRKSSSSKNIKLDLPKWNSLNTQSSRPSVQNKSRNSTSKNVTTIRRRYGGK